MTFGNSKCMILLLSIIGLIMSITVSTLLVLSHIISLKLFDFEIEFLVYCGQVIVISFGCFLITFDKLIRGVIISRISLY